MPLPETVLSGGGSKGNNGRAGRKRLMFKVLVYVALGICAFQTLWKYWLAGVNVPDFEIDQATGQKRIRKKPHKQHKFDPRTGFQVAK